MFILKPQQKPFIKNLEGTKNFNIIHIILYNHWYKKTITPSTVKTTHLQTLVTAVNTKPYGLWWVVSQMKFLTNFQHFIH